MSNKSFVNANFRVIINQAVFFLLIIMLSGWSYRNDSPSNGYAIEENQQENKATYPYVVHTESSTWYLAKDDITLLGEEDYYTGLTEIMEDIDQDFADARAALAGYIYEDIPPVDIFTDFCGKAGISETAGAYYNKRSNFIKVFHGWDMAKESLLQDRKSVV